VYRAKKELVLGYMFIGLGFKVVYNICCEVPVFSWVGQPVSEGGREVVFVVCQVEEVAGGRC